MEEGSSLLDPKCEFEYLEIRILRVSYVALLGAPIVLSLDYNFGKQASMMGFVTIPP